MASIFEGVPFIVRIPGAYNEDSSALNAGLAAGAAAGRTRSAERMQTKQDALEDRRLTIAEKDQELQTRMRDLRVQGLILDQDTQLKNVLDQSALASWMQQLNDDPKTPIPNLNNIANKDKALDIQAKVLAKSGVIDQKELTNNLVKQIGDLAPALRPEYMRRLGEEGATPQLQSDLSEASARIPNANNFAYIQSRYQAAKDAGDEMTASTYAADMEAMANAAAFNKSQFTIETGPDGTTITQGPAKGQSPNIGKTGMEKLDLSRTLGVITDLKKQLRPEDLGLGGVAGDFLDKTLPQLGVNEHYDAARTENRTKLKFLIGSAVRQMTPDNHFSNTDRQRVEQVLPSSGIIESYPHAMQALDTIGEIFGERKMRIIMEQNKNDTARASAEILRNGRFLNPYEVKQAAKMGLITREDALKILTGQ